MTTIHPTVLVDTSVWIDPPSAGFAAYGRKVVTSIVTVAELQHGLHTARTPMEEVRRRRRLQLLLDHYDVLPIDLGVAEIYGATVRAIGRKPGPRALDLLIAATAARHEFPVLTRNHADLKGLEEVVVVIPVS
jgi:predicted nucleic acid-binding protein